MPGMSFVSALWSAHRVFSFYLVLGLTMGLTLDSEKQPWANFHYLFPSKWSLSLALCGKWGEGWLNVVIES